MPRPQLRSHARHCLLRPPVPVPPKAVPALLCRARASSLHSSAHQPFARLTPAEPRAHALRLRSACHQLNAGALPLGPPAPCTCSAQACAAPLPPEPPRRETAALRTPAPPPARAAPHAWATVSPHRSHAWPPPCVRSANASASRAFRPPARCCAPPNPAPAPARAPALTAARALPCAVRSGPHAPATRPCARQLAPPASCSRLLPAARLEPLGAAQQSRVEEIDERE
ncbi:formin-like protein 6 [Panicum hallii]|uniref:formin-like protein 6 n=1 Tax=Panicum hallii TaxID=206008 RepID=UPI000DF4CE3B|nr:formin-like protein 6 [Panicum hallii]